MPKEVFDDVLDRKLAFLHHKNIEFKKWQNLHFFSGGFVHGFGQKLAIFLCPVC